MFSLRSSVSHTLFSPVEWSSIIVQSKYEDETTERKKKIGKAAELGWASEVEQGRTAKKANYCDDLRLAEHPIPWLPGTLDEQGGWAGG